MSARRVSDLKRLPHKRHNDLVIVNKKLFDSFEEIDRRELIEELCTRFKCNRLAVETKISCDQIRTPVVELVRGDHSWVTHNDNGIIYTLDVTKCMFSFGNIREKLRVSRIDCTGETVVDLFAGIGYFSIVFAVHSNAKLLHLCECNPNAVIALKKNLELNSVSHKCVIHEGDNRQVCPVGVADRVYMGLIPTSLESLEVGCRAINVNSDKRILHIHHNVSHFGTKDRSQIERIWNEWAIEVSHKVKRIMCEIHANHKWFVEVLQVNKVKAYAPHIDHLVVDLKCSAQDIT